MGHIAEGAAAAGHVHVLDWMLSVARVPGHLLDPIDYKIVQNAVRHAAPTAHLRFKGLFDYATRHCQLLSLSWMKDKYVDHGIEYDFVPVERDIGAWPAMGEHRVVMLNWWKAEYASRSKPMFPANQFFPPGLAYCTDNRLLVIDWLRSYYAETGREFNWCKLDINYLAFMVIEDSLELCQWWWDETVKRIGIEQAKPLLRKALKTMCDYGRLNFLDWCWSIFSDSAANIDDHWSWRPAQPLFRLNVIQWREAKVELGEIGSQVLAIGRCDAWERMDTLLSTSYIEKFEVRAMDWWWARRDVIGLKACVSRDTMSRYCGNAIQSPCSGTWIDSHLNRRHFRPPRLISLFR
ncbi:hypothetical protein BC828DRAFT_387092 [Blastocladiella britannica]|nr:hypothetical protein BC828DRAFT_387092 [Blastocladiella britannica]